MAARRTSKETFDLAKSTEAAKVLREHYAEAFGEDKELIADSIEGATNLFDMIEAMLESIADDEALAASAKVREQNQRDRRTRIESRARLKRALVLTAMQIAEVQKREFPVGTVSVSGVAGKPVVTEEADIPAKFFNEVPRPAPVLDAVRLKDAWKERNAAIAEAEAIEDGDERTAALIHINSEHPPIPGSEWSNGGATLTIRFK